MGPASRSAACGLLVSASLSGCCLDLISGENLGSSGGSTTGSAEAGPATTMLWIGGVGAIDPKGLPASGFVPFDESCYPQSSPSEDLGGASAIDGAGDLWAQNSAGLFIWTLEQLAKFCDGTAPSVALSLPLLHAIAFDFDGNLWGSVDADAGYIVGYRASDLMAGGSPAPAWTLTGNCGSLDSLCNPIGLAFDADGNLWAAGRMGLQAFSPSTLTALNDGGPDGTAPLADFHITRGTADFGELAFDAAGNVWVVASGDLAASAEIIAYSRVQLQNASNDDEPQPSLEILVDIVDVPYLGYFPPLAFDGDGNLWLGMGYGIPDAGLPNLVRLSRESLDAGALQLQGPVLILLGDPNPLVPGFPDVAINVPSPTGFSLAFSPIPRGLPIQP